MLGFLVLVPSRAWDTESPHAGLERAVSPASEWGHGPFKTAGQARVGGARGCPGWVGKAVLAVLANRKQTLQPRRGLIFRFLVWVGQRKKVRGWDVVTEGAPRLALPFPWPSGECEVSELAARGLDGVGLVLEYVWEKREL